MFRKNIWIKQDNKSDCAAACLLMIIRIYGGNNSLAKIRYLMHIDENGTSALNLISAAQKLKFEAKGYICDGINNITLLPCIAHAIVENGYQHFIVIKVINKKHQKLYVLDPATGEKWYTYEEFNKIWTKVIIQLKPNCNLDKYNSYRYLMKKILTTLKLYRKKILIIIILSLLYIVFGIINTYYLKLITDHIFTSFNMLIWLFIFFIIITALRVLIDYIRNIMVLNIDKVIDKQLLIDTYRHIFTLPYQFLCEKQTGDLIARISDLSYVRELISRVSILLLADLFLAVFCLIMLFNINLLLTFISLIILLLYLLVVIKYSPPINNYILLNQERQANISSYLIETINKANTIKTLEVEKYAINKIDNKYSLFLNNNYQFNRLYNWQKSLKDLILYGGFTIILFLGSVLISKGDITLSNLILFYSLLIFFWEPIKTLIELEPLIHNALNSLRRVSELYEVNTNENNTGNINFNNGIIFNHLKFSYNNNANVLNDIMLSIKNGEKVIITGESGSGKSTLFKLLLKYYDVDNDMIHLDNTDINEYNYNQINKNICYISQDETLFTDTILNNIILGRNIKKRELDIVLKITKANEIIRKYNDQIILTNTGTNLSGGEKQKIILARSLLKKANTYIFDESTNELDLENEKLILSKIFKKYRNKTIIVISHRVVNLELYDKVITIENGTVKNIKERKGEE